MKKLLFVLLTCLASGLTQAQAPPHYGVEAPASGTGLVYKTGQTSSRVAIPGQDYIDTAAHRLGLSSKSEALSIAALRALSSPSSTLRYYISDKGNEGFWYYDPTDNTSAEDIGSVIVSGSMRYKRIVTNELYVDHFIPSGTTGDLAPYVQKALNAAYGKTLVFTSGKTYTLSPVYLPSSIKINFNNSKIVPSFSTCFGNTWVFNYNSTHIDAAGLYTTATVSATSGNPIVSENIEIYGANFDGQFGRVGLFKANGGIYTYVKNLKIYNNKIKNFSYDAINLSVPTNSIAPGNLYYENLFIENNDFRYGGAFTACVVSGNYSTTANSMVVKTVDGSSITEKMVIGILFQLSTAETSGIDDLGTSTTAAIYRCTGFTQGATADQGAITFAAGSYDATNGFILDGSNAGLHAPIVDGCWLLPISNVDFGLINTLPQFSGTAGTNTLSRTATTTLENAYATNLAVGIKISFATGTAGLYTITAINGTTGNLTVTPALTSSVSAQRPASNGQYGKCIAILGEVRNGNFQRNKFFAAYEAVSVGSTYGPFLSWDELKVNYSFLDNEISYMWMGVEGTPGGVVSNPFTDFQNGTYTAGQTTISNPNPSNYRITSLDLDGNGAPETILTASTTTDGNVNSTNCFAVGDILMLHGIKGRYQITGLTTSAITFARYDHNSRSTISGGLANGGTAIDYKRLYTSSQGQPGGFNTVTFKRNKFHFNTRPAGGHLISMDGDLIVIDDNEFENAERTSLELNFGKAIVSNNIFRNYVFQAGGTSFPGTNATGAGTPQRGYGQYFLFSGADGTIDNNKFFGFEPSTNYSLQAGGIVIGESVNSLYDNAGIKYTNNKVKGLVDVIFRSNNNKTISGTSYSLITHDVVEVSNNTVETGGMFSGYWLGSPIATEYVVKNNTFKCTRASTTYVIHFLTPPSPELNNGASTFPFEFKGNSYNKTTTVISGGNTGYSWYDQPGIAGLVTGSSVTGSGTTADPYVITGTGGGGGSSGRGLPFTTVPFTSTINLDFNSTSDYVVTATGDIAFTKSNAVSGQYFEVKIIKNTSANINITFPSSSWTAPSIINNAPGMATDIQTTPPGFVLTGTTGSIYSVFVKNFDVLPVITLNNTPNFYDPPALSTNMIVWPGSQTAFVDPGNTMAETSVYHVMIPAGTMKAKSRASLKFSQKRANTGQSTVRFKVYAGTSTTPTSNSVFYNLGLSNNGIQNTEAFFQNNNSTSSQVCSPGFNPFPQAYDVNETSFSVPTGTSDWYIDITIQKNIGTDTGAAGLIQLILSDI